MSHTDLITRAEAGRRLRAARKARGLTQAEASARCGLPQSYLSALERGARVCTWPALVGVVAALGYDPELIVPEWFGDSGRR